MQRAVRLEQYLNTPAKIFFKREDLNPTGSHKPNTAIAQAYYAAREGVQELATETGAGQWGSALSYATMRFGINCRVFMVRASYDQKPFRKILMQLYGAKVFASPSNETNAGKKILAENPEHPGSLGIAISEAIETVGASGGKAKYSLGSVLNHVLMHQTVIGEEVLRQFEKIDATPDVMVGCVGGGSNFAGFAFPAVREKMRGKEGYAETEFVAVEPASVPSITKGKYEYDFGDTAGYTPLMKMHTLGHAFVPSPIHAGGLRYHGMAPAVSLLAEAGIMKARSFQQHEAFEAAHLFAKTEGVVPAPETAHAIKAVVEEALECKRTGEEKTIAFNFSGHGLLDLSGYQAYLEGKI